jgi:hypothetical protein
MQVSPLQEVRRIQKISNAVRPGGGHARPRSKYNAPDTMDGRYRRGNRRWSSYDTKKLGSKRPRNVDPQFWTATVTITGGGGGYQGGSPKTYTYSCTCPDKAKQVSASFYGADFVPDPTQFTPRVFRIDTYLHYRSDYVRFQKGLQLLSLVNFIGVQLPATYIYRFPTDRIEKFSRNWVGSQAGLPSGRYCKHIWAVIFYREDPYVEPTDFPDFYYLEDTELDMEGI